MEQSRLSERELTEDMNLSLQALKTDYIDLYLLHRDDRNLPVEQIMDTLDQFVTQGKTRAIGVSNWSADRIFQANRYAHSAGKTPISVSQIQWSYALCTPKMFHDESLICMTEKEYHQYLNMKIPVMAFSSQAKGFFTKAAQDGIQQVGAELKEFVTETNSKRFQILEEYCAKTGCSFAAAALRYLIYNPLPGVAIIGSSNITQLRDSMIQCEENFCPEAIKEFWQIV